MSQQAEQLNESIKILNENIEKRNSFGQVFLRGIVSGVGTAIGATIIAGVLLSILANTINSVDDVPILKDIIEQTNFKQVVETDGEITEVSD